jgi:hypothetical protein
MYLCIAKVVISSDFCAHSACVGTLSSDREEIKDIQPLPLGSLCYPCEFLCDTNLMIQGMRHCCLVARHGGAYLEAAGVFTFDLLRNSLQQILLFFL